MPNPAQLLKSLLVGRPKETARLEHERLPKTIGLAVFASDNLSSSAYATEEMLLVLVLAGTAALRLSIFITLAIVGVLALIAISYRETIRAYPAGGGAYTVAYDNLGRYPGLVAASALLIDYVLTVAVSVSAGIAAVVSAAPGLSGYAVHMAVAVIAIVTTLNLRGARESGRIFAIPTYSFVLLLGGTLVWGLVRHLFLGFEPPTPAPVPAQQGLTLFLIMRAFSHGSTAVTGIEAISNGVPAFREPAARNASTTLAIMASILGFLFVGTTLLAHFFHITGPTEEPHRTVVSIIALTVFGQGPLFFAVQAATALILFLAANTSYADFPRLGAALARDRFAPRQLMNRGDRLAYSNGIVVLAILAAALVVVFGAETSRLINLYVVGVFTSLTLSQTGMVRHWRKRRHERHWRRQATINGIGATATFIVFCIVLLTKFFDGAWIVVATAPLLVYWLNATHRHYERVGIDLRDPARVPPPARTNHVLLLVGTPSEEERRAFAYAERIKVTEFRSVHFAESRDAPSLEARWARELGLLATTPTLEIVRADHGVHRALRGYLEGIRSRLYPGDYVTVIVSERIRAGRLWTFGTRRALAIKTSLLFTPDVVVTDVPFVVGSTQTTLEPGAPIRHVVVVLVSAVHNATFHALAYAKTLSADEIHAAHVALDPEAAQRHAADWRVRDLGLPLEILDSPFRQLAAPVRDYVQTLRSPEPTLVTLIIPEFIVGRWWHHLMHNQNALDIKWTFLAEPDVIVTSVPYRLST